MSARNLRGRDNKTQLTIALIWPIDTRVSLVGRILTGIQKYIASENEHEIKLLVETFSNEDGINSVKGLRTSNLFNGAIIANTTEKDEELIHSFVPDVPIVLFNRFSTLYSVIHSNNYEAGKAVAEHFIKNEHQKAVILVPDVSSQALESGLAGITERFDKEQAAPIKYIKRYCPYTEQGGYDSIQALVREKYIPTAIICLSDHVALGALSALNDEGISVPNECEIIGFDNQEFSKFTNPKLSTVNLPVEDMAYSAGKMLVNKIFDPYSPIESDMFNLRIIHRETTKK